MLQTDKPLILGLSYTGREINDWVKANPDSEISKKLKKLPQWSGKCLLIPDLIYFKVVSKVEPRGVDKSNELIISLERDFHLSPRPLNKMIGGALRDRRKKEVNGKSS